jgi:hypothetical protein
MATALEAPCERDFGVRTRSQARALRRLAATRLGEEGADLDEAGRDAVGSRARARADAADGVIESGEADAAADLPEACPYAPEQALDRGPRPSPPRVAGGVA